MKAGRAGIKLQLNGQTQTRRITMARKNDAVELVANVTRISGRSRRSDRLRAQDFYQLISSRPGQTAPAFSHDRVPGQLSAHKGGIPPRLRHSASHRHCLHTVIPEKGGNPGRVTVGGETVLCVHRGRQTKGCFVRRCNIESGRGCGIANMTL